MIDSNEYGMPMTEEAENLPTMAQLHFNISHSSNQGSVSQRSGVFGGLDRSHVDPGQTPSFNN